MTRTLVVGVGLRSSPLAEIKEDLIELEELVRAEGGEVVGFLTQHLQAFHPATLLGSGKVKELLLLVKDTGAQRVVVDHPLTGVQARNLQTSLGVPVWDRSQIILSIFATRATTYEGKLQVELAQCLDQMPRMINAWHGSLSRQGGGLAAKGAGETALELDRRRLRERISAIRDKLKQVHSHREQHRSARRRGRVASLALIGYTNSGKSSLLNTLTKAETLAQDQVFATLDPTTRKLYLGRDAMPAVLTDTVGFINKLPPQLIEAFKATLEETSQADILLHVIDLSNPAMSKQIEVVDELIREFGWTNKPILHVFNKVDVAPIEKQFKVTQHPRVFVSAKTGQGLDRLKSTLLAMLETHKKCPVELFFPRGSEDRVFDLTRTALVHRQEKSSVGTVCFAELTERELVEYSDFLSEKSV